MKALYLKFELWIISHLFVLGVALDGLFRGYRMSHNQGVCASGKLRIVENPQFPENDFFKPGRAFDCRMRFASASFEDEGMPQVRGFSLKFANTQYKAPYDLQMNTGERTLFWSTANFIQFATSRKNKKGIQYIEYFKKEDEGRLGGGYSIRMNMDSYLDLYYNSKTPTLFVAKNGDKYYAKYRCIPADGRPEKGIPTEEWSKNYHGNQQCPPEETRDVDYLSQETARLINAGGVELLIQIQLIKAGQDDPQELFHSNIIHPRWKEAAWMDLATVKPDTVLEYEDAKRTVFSLSQTPKALGNIPAKSLHDYNSLVYTRSKDGLASKARKVRYAFAGIPKEVTGKRTPEKTNK